MNFYDRISKLFRPSEANPQIENAAPSSSVRPGALTSELGSTGLKQYGGIIAEEWLPALMGERGIRTYREMVEGDPTVGAVLFAIEMLLRQVTWDVEPASEDGKDRERADFLRECLNDMERPWKSTISEILTMLGYGWSVHEIVYKVRRGPGADVPSGFDDGKIGWRRLPIRGQDTLDHWELDEHENVKAFVQVHPQTFRTIELPAEKIVHFKTRERRGPEGISALRSAYRPWLFKKRLEEIEAIGLERDMAGLPIAYVPPEVLSPAASAGQLALLEQVKKIVRGVKVNEQMGIVFPLEYDRDGHKRYEFTLVNSFGRAKTSPDPAIQRYKQDIAMTVLADFILLGHERVGSFALSSSKTEIFAAALGSWLDAIADTMNIQAVTRLFKVNGHVGALPRIVHGDVETPDLDQLSNFVLRLANAGAITVPDEKLERHLRRAASLPEREEGEE